MDKFKVLEIKKSVFSGNEKRADELRNRQQLADYLAVERSAMSAELSRMKKDGLLDYHKNHFRLFTK